MPLVDLSMVEQRYDAVREVLEGASVKDTATRYGIDRRTLHRWLVRYATDGLAALADKSSKPDRCPHQMAPEIEARIIEMRRSHPGWGPRTILNKLRRELESPPSRAAIYRCLVRHRLISPKPRRRRRDDYKRWERSRKRRLAGLRRSDIQEWIASMLEEGLSPSRARQAVIVLRLMLDAAVDDRLIARNPADRIKLPKIPHKEAEYFDPAVADRLVDTVPEEHRLLFRVLATLGLRYGEAVALRRRHVDFLRRRLRVEESLAEVSGKLIFGPTKSHAERAIPLPPSLMTELEQHLGTIDSDPETLLFTGEKGGPLRYRYVYMDVWRPLLKKLGLPTVGLHALRHSAAARMISAGASPKAVQSIMGHRSAAFTLTVYGHLFDEDLDALASRLDASGSAAR